MNLNLFLSIFVFEKEEVDGGVNVGYGLRDVSVVGVVLSVRVMFLGVVGGLIFVK